MQIGIRCRKNLVVDNKENLRINNQSSKVSSIQKEIQHILLAKQISSSPEDVFTPIDSNRSCQSILQDVPLLQLLENSGCKCQKNIDSLVFLSLYEKEIQEESLKKEKMGYFLKNHQIDVSLRARMLDWMTEVTCSYKFSSKTYFDGVMYLDKFLSKKQSIVKPEELHGLGVASMLLSSKANEMFPLNLMTAFEKIAHRKIPLSKLQYNEADIMDTLNFKLTEWTFYDIAAMYLAVSSNSLLLPVLAYICRLIVIQYQFYCNSKPYILGKAAAWVTLLICEEKHPENMKCSQQIEREGRRIMDLMFDFRINYPNLRNADKFSEDQVLTKIHSFLQSN